MTKTLELELRGPGGEPIDLHRTLNSHGFAELAPARLDETARALDITLRLPGARPRRVRVGAASAPGRALVTIFGPSPGARTREEIRAQMRHVLRFDADLSEFYSMAASDPELDWVTEGAGRMLQSPTVFEDVVKTICTTNCAWGATVRMVNALVEHLGETPSGDDGPLANAFPSPEAMAGAPESFYRDVARAGYRSTYLISVSRMVATGALDLEALADADPADLPDEELERALLEIPGVGPYAAAHIMMTVGRYSRLILDSWSRPQYARLVGKETVKDPAIRRRFRSYGPYAGLAFWLFITRDWVK